MLSLTADNIGLLLISPMLYEALVAATFLTRGRSRRSLTGVGPRTAAYGATFLIPVFLWSSVRWAPEFVAASSNSFLRVAGASSWLLGSVIAFWPIWYMRRSFSIEPAARELSSTGPYAFARHPMYATHILEYVGIWLLHATIQFGIVLLVWFVLLRVRIGYEERVMRAEFPQYATYRNRVGAFGPRLRTTPPERGS